MLARVMERDDLVKGARSRPTMIWIGMSYTIDEPNMSGTSSLGAMMFGFGVGNMQPPKAAHAIIIGNPAAGVCMSTCLRADPYTCRWRFWMAG